MLRTETYVTRARCVCGYLWSDPGSANIVCICGESYIKDDVLISGPDLMFSEEEFKQAVADDTGFSLEDVIVIEGV